MPGMDFFKLIQSLDELVYEVLSWLLFYPRTLWAMLRRPVTTMNSAETELTEDVKTQFDDMIGPPLFLALTLTLIHLVELQVVGQDSRVTSTTGFSKFISNDTNLLVLRIVLFGLLPLTVARRLLKVQGLRLDKEALRAPFYAQCYAAAIYAILFNAGLFLLQNKTIANPAAWGVGVAGIAVAWFLAVETIWFRRKLAVGVGRGLWNAFVVFAEWMGILLLIGLVIR